MVVGATDFLGAVFANFGERTYEEAGLGNLGGPIYTHVVFLRDANGVPTGIINRR